MDKIKIWAKYLFVTNPLIGFGLLGAILWVVVDFILGVIVLSVGLYLYFRREDAKKAESNETKKCLECQMDIPFLARKCPHCHTKIKQQLPPISKVVVFLAVVSVIWSITLSMSSVSTTTIDTYTPPVRHQTIEQQFDVPSLVGLDLEELESILGIPSIDSEPTETYSQFSDIRTWEKTWSKSGYSLMVTYNIDTMEVEDLFLGTETDAALSTFTNVDSILRVGNLSQTDPNYSLEFIKLKAILGKPKSETPEGYTGVIIRSK